MADTSSTQGIASIKVLDKVLDKVFASCVHSLESFVRIPFVSNGENNPDLMRTSAQFVYDSLKSLGVKVQYASATKDDGEEGNVAVIGYLGAGENGEIDPDKKTILLYAHHDVQPVQHPENWNTPPFEPVRVQTSQGERLYGRGSADDGAGIIAHLGALQLAQQPDKPLDVNVKVFIEGEEEIGSPSFANFIQKYREELKADLIIVADSGNWAVGVPAITTTLRGVCTIDVELNVLEHSIHSGMSSGPIIDANALLMMAITKIWDQSGEVVVPGLVGARDLPVEEPGVDYTLPDFRNDTSLLEGIELAGSGTIAGRIWNKPSVCVIGFDATPTSQASNVFAPSAKARLSLRVSPGQDPVEAGNALMKHLEKSTPFNARLNTTLLEAGPGFKADIDSPGAKAFKQALEEGFGHDVVYAGMGGSIPFTADLKKTFPEAEVLLAGVEDPDSRAHSDNESVSLDDLKKVIHSEYLLLERLGEL
jgi:acetylornithine deacetylase/succinyl-diaminopimelate desuccinylase-like protein